MAIELDIEDIFGAGCLSSLGRALATLTCLWMGAATGSLGVLIAEAAVEVLDGRTPDTLEWAFRVLAVLGWGPLMILTGALLPLFFPLAFLVYFKFARGDGGNPRSWLIYAGITGLLVLLSYNSWDHLGLLGSVLSVVLWLGFFGSLAMLAFLIVAWQRRRLAEHLIVLAAENNERRRALAEEFGTAVADREFATGESQVWAPPPEPERLHPKVPRPPRGETE